MNGETKRRLCVHRLACERIAKSRGPIYDEIHRALRCSECPFFQEEQWQRPNMN